MNNYSTKQSEIISLRKEIRELRAEHEQYTNSIVEQNEAMNDAVKIANKKCDDLSEQIKHCKVFLFFNSFYLI